VVGGRFEKAVILAAGRGKRLRHETEDLPKALVDVGGFTLLELILKNISSYTGVQSVVVATGHFNELIEERIGRKRDGLDIEYVVNQHYESTNNCYTMWLLKEHLAEGFLLVNTDVLFDGRILEKALAAPHESFIVVDAVQRLDEEDMKVEFVGSRIVNISKELDPAGSHGEYIGILGFDPETAQALIKELDKTVVNRGERGIYYEDVIQEMLEDWPIYAVGSDPYDWIEIDTLDDLSRARGEIYTRIAGALGWK
jgi:choline kinase